MSLPKLELYGVRRSFGQEFVGGNFETFEDRDLVATFSSRRKLEAFLKKRLLKNPIREHGFEPERKFRKNSDLGCYNDYEIGTAVERSVPHDPE